MQITAAASGAKGLSPSASPASAKAAQAAMPTSQPTPGKCAALARTVSGLASIHWASVPLTGTRVKDWTAKRYWRRKPMRPW